MSQFPQSLQAIAAIYTAKKYMHHQEKSAQKYSNSNDSTSNYYYSSSLMLSDLNVPQYTTEQVKSCAKCFNQLAKLIQRSKLQNIVKKFKGSKFFEVARIILAHGQSSSQQSATGASGGADKRHKSFQSLPSNGKTARDTKNANTAAGTASGSNRKASAGGIGE